MATIFWSQDHSEIVTRHPAVVCRRGEDLKPHDTVQLRENVVRWGSVQFRLSEAEWKPWLKPVQIMKVNNSLHSDLNRRSQGEEEAEVAGGDEFLKKG